MNSMARYGNIHGYPYCPPKSFEMMGKTWRFVIDGSGELLLIVTDETNLTVIKPGEPPQTAPYLCMKADDTVYLLCTGSDEHTMIIVLDTGKNLVSYVTLGKPGNKQPEAKIHFGAVAHEGTEIPAQRHCFTDDLWENRLCWTFGSELSFIHSYESGCKCSISAQNGQSAIMDAKAVQIGQGLYFLLMCGQEPNGFFEQTSCFLMNFNRITAVGFAFGPDMRPEPFGAIGSFE
ncbi:MAG: hypothetical protein GX111_01570 [Clostridiales bacterium]|nr:hypothetical protein [Clostridiales bacterium]